MTMTNDEDGPRMMNHERPLDALLPELGEAHAPIPLTHVHQRVLEVATDDGDLEWLLICWRDPGGPQALHQSLMPVVEATLLAELSRPANNLGTARHVGIRLALFETVADVAAATAAFGFHEQTWDAHAQPGTMAAIRDEAARVGLQVPERPVALWHAPIRHPEGDHGARLFELQQMMSARMQDDVWGATPGGPSKLLANYIERMFRETIAPDLDGLSTLELLLVQRERDEVSDMGPIRWIPPLLFQALADFVGVVATTVFGARVQWAVCEQDALGLYPPPHFRVDVPGGQSYYLPVGLHLVRWCMMPLRAGEDVPTLAEWLADQFGP